jgi:rhodanese-related sulfurtransferase
VEVRSGVGGDVQIESVSVEETWARLKSDAGSVLIDVRTGAEWAYVGLPDLSLLGKRPVLIEWQGFLGGRSNPVFVDQVVEALAAIGANKDSELFFLCRSGGRSLGAARAMTGAGYSRCRNVADGFEGPLDPNRHRGMLGGWKAKGLPWVQG